MFPHFNDIPIAAYENAVPQMVCDIQSWSYHWKQLKEIGNNQMFVKWDWVVQGPNDKQVSMASTSKFSLNMCDC